MARVFTISNGQDGALKCDVVDDPQCGAFRANARDMLAVNKVEAPSAGLGMSATMVAPSVEMT